MTLLAHVTPPDTVAFVAVYALGILTGIALAWLGRQVWVHRKR